MKKSKWLRAAAVGLVIALISTLFYTSYFVAFSTGRIGGAFNFAESPLKDLLRTKSMAERQPEDRIKIIKIDDASLEAIGQFPWPRSVYAELIGMLEEAGVRAVALDIVTAEPSEDPADDAAMAEIMKQYTNVILPVQFNFVTKQKAKGEFEAESIDYPASTIQAPTAQLGHVNVMPDKDGTVRMLTVGVPEPSGNVMPALSVKLANYLLDDQDQIRWDAARNGFYRGDREIPVNYRNQVLTEFFSKPRQQQDAQSGYDAQSFIDVLSGTIPADYYADSVVLIGPYTTGLMDEYLTPEHSSMKMFGVEIHANMVQSLVEGRFYVELDLKAGILIIVFVTFLGVFLFQRFRGRSALLIYLGMVIGYAAVWLQVFYFQSYIIPVIYPLLAITVAYVWSIFSHYMAERKERSRVTNIFGRFVSKSVVDELLSSGEEVKLGGQRRDITLIFVDIRGFTPMSERLEPEQVIQVLNEYLDVCTKAIFKFNGTLDKFIGDGVMAIFGAPIPFDNHPEMAVRAALEMKKHADVLERKLIDTYGIGVKFGLGINSGPAVVGNIGSEGLRLDYTAIGDTVNLSARLESNAKPGQLLISEHTYERVKDLFVIDPIGEIKVKGKEKPVMVYEVISELI